MDLPRMRSMRTNGMTLPPEYRVGARVLCADIPQYRAFTRATAPGRAEGSARSRPHALAPRFFNESLGLRSAGDGQLARVEETDLSEHAGLIPVDMLVGNLAPFKFHHDHMRQRDLPSGRR